MCYISCSVVEATQIHVLVRPDQLNCLFIGSDRSVFTALEKMKLIDGCDLASIVRYNYRQKIPGITISTL